MTQGYLCDLCGVFVKASNSFHDTEGTFSYKHPDPDANEPGWVNNDFCLKCATEIHETIQKMKPQHCDDCGWTLAIDEQDREVYCPGCKRR